VTDPRDRFVEAGVHDEPPSAPPTVCPFLRRADGSDVLGDLDSPVVPGNRCGAVDDPTPLSERQQALVCSLAAHRDCPRYRRATDAVPIAPIELLPPRALPGATVAASLILAASAVVAFGFVLANGGISAPIASQRPQPSPSLLAVASPPPSVAASPSPVRTPSPAPSPEPSASPIPSPSPVPSPSLSPVPSPSPSPAAISPSPTSDRYALLDPCPDRPACYIYVIRAGDNLSSIATYFGVPLPTVQALNPWTQTTGLRPGQLLILPPPTR
jgi:hypothetical protein